MPTRRDKINDRSKYIFRAESNASGGYDVVRRIAGSSQSWVMITYDHAQDAGLLVEELQLLEMRVWARQIRASREKT